MKVFVSFAVAVVAVLCVTIYAECPKKSCYKWPGCEVSFNVERCRCESVCDRSDSECDKRPCLSNGFCYGYRVANYDCQCINSCKDPPYCQYGYKLCNVWSNCSCNDKQDSSEWSTSSESFSLEQNLDEELM